VPSPSDDSSPLIPARAVSAVSLYPVVLCKPSAHTPNRALSDKMLLHSRFTRPLFPPFNKLSTPRTVQFSPLPCTIFSPTLATPFPCGPFLEPKLELHSQSVLRSPSRSLQRRQRVTLRYPRSAIFHGLNCRSPLKGFLFFLGALPSFPFCFLSDARPLFTRASLHDPRPHSSLSTLLIAVCSFFRPANRERLMSALLHSPHPPSGFGSPSRP